MAGSLARFKDKLRQSAANGRKASKARQERMELYRTGGAIGGGALIGALPRMGVPTAIMNVPIKAVVGVIALAVESFTGGKMQAMASGVKYAAGATYAERAVATKSLIAGDDENADGTFSV